MEKVNALNNLSNVDEQNWAGVVVKPEMSIEQDEPILRRTVLYIDPAFFGTTQVDTTQVDTTQVDTTQVGTTQVDTNVWYPNDSLYKQYLELTDLVDEVNKTMSRIRDNKRRVNFLEKDFKIMQEKNDRDISDFLKESETHRDILDVKMQIEKDELFIKKTNTGTSQEILSRYNEYYSDAFNFIKNNDLIGKGITVMSIISSAKIDKFLSQMKKVNKKEYDTVHKYFGIN
jgi:hypothetical protein